METDESQSVHTVKTDELPKSIRKQNCLKEIEDTINLIGPNPNITQIAKKYGFAWNTVRDWTRKIFLGRMKEPIDLIAHKAEESLANGLRFCERMIVNPNIDDDTKLTALRIMLDFLKGQAEILERYGRKPKATDNLNVTNLPAQFTLIEKSIEEIKNAKHSNKPQASGTTESTQ